MSTRKIKSHNMTKELLDSIDIIELRKLARIVNLNNLNDMSEFELRSALMTAFNLN